jgi:hypothetical protein
MLPIPLGLALRLPVAWSAIEFRKCGMVLSIRID